MVGLHSLYREADAVFNLCGAQELHPEHRDVRCLVYLETDPVANQVGVATGHLPTIEALAAHHYIFTYGENLGAADCRVPVERFQWQPTRPPVCIDWWTTRAPPAAGAALTTIANWKHTGKDIVWQDETYYWSKHLEFQHFINLPSRSALPLELAIGGVSDDERADMRRHGWRVVPSVSLAEPSAYREYIRASRGEFTVAKDQNIRLRSGWFSDRSACYLAAGRPVITQETGFSKFLPTGKGLFGFKTMDDIVRAIDAVEADYEGNCSAAREIAAEYFAAEKIVGSLMQRAGL